MQFYSSIKVNDGSQPVTNQQISDLNKVLNWLKGEPGVDVKESVKNEDLGFLNASTLQEFALMLGDPSTESYREIGATKPQDFVSMVYHEPFAGVASNADPCHIYLAMMHETGLTEMLVGVKGKEAERDGSPNGGVLPPLTLVPMPFIGYVPVVDTRHAPGYDRPLTRIARPTIGLSTCHAKTHLAEAQHLGFDIFESGLPDGAAPFTVYRARQLRMGDDLTMIAEMKRLLIAARIRADTLLLPIAYDNCKCKKVTVHVLWGGMQYDNATNQAIE